MFAVVGVTTKGIRESARMAYDYLRANGKKIGMDRDVGEYDVNLQVMSLSAGKDATDLGMAFYIALLSAALGRAIGAQLVVLGQMSLHGVLSRVDGLGDKLRVAMDAGARRVLIPTENTRDLGALPAEVLDKLRIDFYSEHPRRHSRHWQSEKRLGLIPKHGNFKTLIELHAGFRVGVKASTDTAISAR
jgi:ATP-dependent Lon protease